MKEIKDLYRVMASLFTTSQGGVSSDWCAIDCDLSDFGGVQLSCTPTFPSYDPDSGDNVCDHCEACNDFYDQELDPFCKIPVLDGDGNPTGDYTHLSLNDIIEKLKERGACTACVPSKQEEPNAYTRKRLLNECLTSLAEAIIFMCQYTDSPVGEHMYCYEDCMECKGACCKPNSPFSGSGYSCHQSTQVNCESGMEGSIFKGLEVPCELDTCDHDEDEGCCCREDGTTTHGTRAECDGEGDSFIQYATCFEPGLCADVDVPESKEGYCCIRNFPNAGDHTCATHLKTKIKCEAHEAGVWLSGPPCQGYGDERCQGPQPPKGPGGPGGYQHQV